MGLWVLRYTHSPAVVLGFSDGSHVVNVSFNDVSSVVVVVLTTLEQWVCGFYGLPIHLLLFVGSLSFHVLLSLASMTSHPCCWCFDDLGPAVDGGLNDSIFTSCCPCVLRLNSYLWLLVSLHVSPPMMV